MMLRSNDIRFASIALAAVMAVLSFGADATAQSDSGRAQRSARSCCSSRVCPSGCCATRDAVSDSRGSDRLIVIAPQATGLTRPGSSCECQRDEPVAPAARPELGAARSRPSDESCEVAFLHIPSTDPGLAARLIEPEQWPPGSPLYLAVSRLRI
jgi:hypothetical protein